MSIHHLISEGRGEAPGDEAPKYDVVTEAEAITHSSAGSGEDFMKCLEAAEAKLFKAYIEACGKEEWFSALAIHQFLKELGCIYDFDPEEELNNSLEEWIARAGKPQELYVCY